VQDSLTYDDIVNVIMHGDSKHNINIIMLANLLCW